MNYADIMNALPGDVADLLHKKLDDIEFPLGTTEDEAKELIQTAVELTRLEMVIADDEKRRLVESLLSFVASAGSKVLFA